MTDEKQPVKVCEKCGAEYPANWVGFCANTTVLDSKRFSICGGRLRKTANRANS
jgi:hypothetical protein